MDTDIFDKNLSLQWDVLEFCDNKHLYNCAKYLCQFVQELNATSKDFQNMIKSKEISDERYKKLSEQIKNEDNSCKNCINLQQKIQNQNSKFKTIADIFGQLTSENLESKNTNESLEKAHDILTQIGDEYNQIPSSGSQDDINRKTKQQRSPLNEKINLLSRDIFYSTPSKKKCVRNADEKLQNSVAEIKEAVNLHTSPILKKGKSNKIFWTDSPNKKLPNINLAKKYQYEDDNRKSPGKENQSLEIETSFLDTFEFSEKNVKQEDGSKKIKKSLSLIHNKSLKKGESDQNLRQARLTFTKVKPTLLLDVSREESFCGGMRTTVTEDRLKNAEEEDIFSPIAKPHEKKFKTNDIDVIDESPSCTIKSPKKRPKSTSIKNKIKIEPTDDTKSKFGTAIGDDDTTFLSDSQSIINFGNFVKVKSEELKKSTSPKDSNKDPVNKPLLEIVYKEEPIRKKSEKDKLPGWGCKKCKDFYSVAFKGNDEMLRKKINECSKHRGKFNPERNNTPPGFWSTDMMPTQDTETFNRLNNQD